MTGDEVRKLKDEEIEIEVGRLRERLVTLRTQSVTEKVEDVSQFSKTRKDIARLLQERRRRDIDKGVATPRPRRQKRQARMEGAGA